MTDRDAARLAVAGALAEGRSAAEALASWPAPLAATARQHFEAGRLDDGLAALDVPPDLRAVAAAWPAAFRVASRAVDRLPRSADLAAPTLLAVAYLALVLGVQVLAWLFVRSKIWPQLELIQLDAGTRPLPWLEWCPPLFALSFAVLVIAAAMAVSGFGAGGWGWSRPAAGARTAGLVRALFAAGAPAELAVAFAGRVIDAGGQATSSADWAAAARLHEDSAWAASRRLAVTTRLAGTTLLLGAALALTAAVYGSISSFTVGL